MRRRADALFASSVRTVAGIDLREGNQFLSHDSDFEIIAFNTFLEEFRAQRFAGHMPICLDNKGGSIWIRRK
ncbi:hypothetical protein [uncultured Fibrella sp.]|uniref:hypothetical protein n=1 Tax=uncultured Fibrella sp. TaxID=1284596 RepID=UPI0035CA686B